MKKCKVCNGSAITYYKYGNHLNKWDTHILKLRIARLLPQLYKLFRPNRCIKDALLFSSLYKIAKCNDCGYSIYDRYIDTEQLNKYYIKEYWGSKNVENICNQDKDYLQDDRAVGQYAFVRDYLIDNEIEITLEIGAGSAMFSRLLSHYFPNTDVEVVEPGIGWNTYYNNYEIKKISNFFPFNSGKKYDFIHASHWLEHVVPDIDKIIFSIRKSIRSGGLIFIEVPNCNDEYWKSDCGDMPHIHFFTKKSLVLLFEQVGFKCLNIDTYGPTIRETLDYFHPSTKICEPTYELIKIVDNSIRNSIPREGGDCIRALFRFID